MENTELTVQDKTESQEESTQPGRAYVPQVDIYESPEALWLQADVPGVDEQSIDVNLRDGVLTIEGQVALAEYEKLEPAYSEYRVGNWARSFRVSPDIDAGRIEARLAHGVLEVELPKVEAAKPRRIPVAAA